MKTEGKIIFGQKSISFSISRSVHRKKTIAISIEPTGGVLVRVPVNTSNSSLTNIVQSKAKWIIEKLRTIEGVSIPLKKEFVIGESFSYLGRHMRLKILKSSNVKKHAVRMYRGRLEVMLNLSSMNGESNGEIKDAITRWYKMRSSKYISSRVKIYATQIGLPEPQVFIRNQQKIWGSCNAKGELRFNWKIIMAPVSIIDYVVVHELCHLKYHNHSKAFWKYLGMILPDYERQKERLMKEGILYNL